MIARGEQSIRKLGEADLACTVKAKVFRLEWRRTTRLRVKTTGVSNDGQRRGREWAVVMVVAGVATTSTATATAKIPDRFHLRGPAREGLPVLLPLKPYLFLQL